MAFARQLVYGNCTCKDDVDLKSITSWDVVVKAFRVHMGLEEGRELIVCIDELGLLNTHLQDIYREANPDEERVKRLALDRCKALRTALMKYQDDCTARGLPEIRFVWTSLTYLFDEELQESKGSKRMIEQIPLHNLDGEGAWELLGQGLQEVVEKSNTLQWAFQMCSGNPRAIVDGFKANYNDVAENITDGHIILVGKIMQACRFETVHHSLVSENIYSVLTCSLSHDAKSSLQEKGALQSDSNGIDFINPALVYSWASTERACSEFQQQKTWVRDYFGSDKLMDPKMFERQTLVYEALLHMAFAVKKLEPTVEDYFAPAFVVAELKELKIKPDRTISIFEPTSLENLSGEELYNKLRKGCRIYSNYVSQAGVDIMIPLFLKDSQGLRLLCCQNKLISEVEGLKKVEDKAVDIDAVKKMGTWCRSAEKDAIAVHPLLYTHDRDLQTSLRTGVWFTRETMTKWFGRLGVARLSFRGKRKREEEEEGNSHSGKKKQKTDG